MLDEWVCYCTGTFCYYTVPHYVLVCHWIAIALGMEAASHQSPIVLSRSAAFHLLWQLTLATSLATAAAPTLPWSKGTQAHICPEMRLLDKEQLSGESSADAQLYQL